MAPTMVLSGASFNRFRLASPGQSSVLRFAGIFRDAWVVQDLHGGGIPEVFPILEHPHDLFLRCHFDELRTLPFAAARGKDGVSVGEAGAGLWGGGELILRRE